MTALAARVAQVGSEVAVTVLCRGGDTCAGVDAAVVERALAPVVDNALRYAVHEVRLEVSGTADAVLVDVLDDGPGIAPQSREAVFEAGRRGDPADGHHGAGLGLALARRLVVASGGAITVMPSQRGAAFRLTLPTG